MLAQSPVCKRPVPKRVLAMLTQQQVPKTSLALVMLAVVLGACFPGILIADIALPLALRLLLAGLPLIAIPFAIGWFSPSMWWLASAGAILPLMFGIMALTTSPPQVLSELLAR